MILGIRKPSVNRPGEPPRRRYSQIPCAALGISDNRFRRLFPLKTVDPLPRKDSRLSGLRIRQRGPSIVYILRLWLTIAKTHKPKFDRRRQNGRDAGVYLFFTRKKDASRDRGYPRRHPVRFRKTSETRLPPARRSIVDRGNPVTTRLFGRVERLVGQFIQLILFDKHSLRPYDADGHG